MQFLNPEALWALFLIAIPILIHLFNLRRIKKVYFSNLVFLKEVSQQQKSRSNLKKLLILACRVLAIGFLVIAFSRPVFKSEVKQDLQVSPIIYLDNSLSLQRTDETGSLLFFNAINSIEGVVSDLPKDYELGLLTNDKYSVNMMPVPRFIESLQATDYSQRSIPLRNIYQKINRLPTNDLWVFSDLQRSTTLPLEEILNDTTRKVSFYALNGNTDKNLYIDTVFLDKPLGVRTQNVLNIGIKNTGEESVEDVLVKVFKDDQQISSYTLNVPSKNVEFAQLEIGVNGTLAGLYRVEIDDTPIVFDNIFYFTIAPANRPRVTILYEDAVNTYLENVYSKDEYFSLTTSSVDNVSLQDIVRSDLLVLDHLTQIPSWLISQLDNLQGDVVVVPGEQIDSDSYQSLLGFQLGDSRNDLRSAISSRSLESGFLSGVFNKQEQSMSMPEVAISYNLSGYYQELLETNTNEPVLVESGSRPVYFFNTSLDESQTNLPKHALFVPVMYKLAQEKSKQQLSYRLDENIISLNIDSVSAQNILKLVNDEGYFVPSTRFVENRIIMDLPEELNEPGFYHLMSNGDTLKRVAFNYNKAESEIESLPVEEFRSLIAGYDHVTLEEIQDVQAFIGQKKTENPDSLWKYALILVLFFLIIELLLLRFI